MSRNDLVKEIQKEAQNTRSIRGKERSLKARKGDKMTSITSLGDLRGRLKHIMPEHLIPGNIGELSEVMWPFKYEFNFDLSDPNTPADLSIPANLKLEDRVQVSKEGAFLLTSFYRDEVSEGIAGFGAPVQFDLRDNTSSRQLNDKPIQLQHYGYIGIPTRFPFPFIVQPNASLTMSMSSWYPNDINVIGAGTDAQIKIVLQGVRVRVNDLNKVLRKFFLA